MPDGPAPVNQAGLDFYRRLVDGLLERGIAPAADALPLGPAAGAAGRRAAGPTATPPTGSPTTPSSSGQALGDRVPGITTLNEPWCSAFLGYAPACTPRAYRQRRGARRRAPPQPGARPRGRGAACDPAAAASCRSPSTSHRSSPATERRGPRRGRARRRGSPTGSSSTRCCAAATRPTCSPSTRHLHRLGVRARRRPGRDRGPDRRRSASTTTPRHRRGRRDAAPRQAGRPLGRTTRSAPSGPSPMAGHRPGLRGAAGRARTPTWAGRSRPDSLTDLLLRRAPRLPGAAAVHHRERRRLRRRARRRRRGARRRPDRLPARAPGRGARRDRRPAPTSAATTSGRCWTTSSGPRATPSASASSTSTTPASDACRRTRRAGTPT